MGMLELLFLSIGLAMDAVAVSMTNGMVYKDLKARHYIAMPLFLEYFKVLCRFWDFLRAVCLQKFWTDIQA